MAFSDPLQWIIIGVVVIVVLFAAFFYYFGKSRGELKAIKETNHPKPVA